MRKASARNHVDSGSNQASVLAGSPVAAHPSVVQLERAVDRLRELVPDDAPHHALDGAAEQRGTGGVHVPEPPVLAQHEQRPLHALDGPQQEISGQRRRLVPGHAVTLPHPVAHTGTCSPSVRARSLDRPRPAGASRRSPTPWQPPGRSTQSRCRRPLVDTGGHAAPTPGPPAWAAGPGGPQWARGTAGRTGRPPPRIPMRGCSCGSSRRCRRPSASSTPTGASDTSTQKPNG